MSDGNTCFMRKEHAKCYSLTICGHNLTEVSDQTVWEQCNRLKTVILYMNEFTALPSELSKFSDDISLLCIMHNKFSEIPSIAYKFKNLEDLVMHGNYLSIIQEDISTFTKLTKLYLGANDIICLPDVFNSFSKLKKASFGVNSLTRLPPSFSTLSQLESLNISDNAIIRFPKPLLELHSLKFLNIERNRIQRFTPTEDDTELYESTFKFFGRLLHFQIKGNPICLHKCLEGIHQNAILKVLTDKKVFRELSKIKPTRSLRVNVLGKVRSGKTSVVQAFTRQKYVIPTTEQSHRHTVGIDRYYFPVRIGEETVLLHIWDHAGDNEYAMMNDLFISDKSLVWLVVDLENYHPSGLEEDEALFQQHIGHWLLQVILHNSTPAVWIVCTHSDRCSGHDNKLKTQHMKFWTDELCKKLQESVTKRKDERCISDQRVYETSGMLYHENVPQVLKAHIEIIEMSNTYNFDGLYRLHEAFKELSSNPIFSDVTLPLPIKWETAADNLKIYAEKELLSYQCIPAVSTVSEEFEKIIVETFSAEEKVVFLEYLHDIGEIYWLKSEEKQIAVLDVDWMINLLKQVYHLKFDERLQVARKRLSFKNIRKETIDDSSSMRKKCGLIAESILKPLWKCNDRNELFEKITKLFVKFDLAYPVKREKYGAPQTFYFFPYLTKSKFPQENDNRFFQRSHITLQFEFDFFFPKFFLQRLALQFWQGNNNTTIYKDGFKTELSSGICLQITRLQTITPTQGMTIFIYFADSDTLWCELLHILMHMHAILSSYWKFCGDADVFVACPKCIQCRKPCKPCNFIRLVQFTGYDFADILRSKSALYCKDCGGQTYIKELVPPPTLNFSESCQFVTPCHISSMEDFRSVISTKWDIYSPLRTMSVGNTGSKQSHPSPTQAFSVGSEHSSEVCSSSSDNWCCRPVQNN